MGQTVLAKPYLRLAVGFIIAVCVYDIYCTVRYNSDILDRERNPIAGLLIMTTEHKHHCVNCETNEELSSVFYETDVSLLVAFKVAGLCAAQWVFGIVLRMQRTAMASVVILSILAVQICLLAVLTC